MAGSLTSNNYFSNLNELYTIFNSSSSLSASFVENALSANLQAKPLVDYSNFKKHTFFDNAVKKLDYAFNKIANEYPIGLNGAAITGLTAFDIYKTYKFIDSCTEFEKFVINYLGGITGTLTTASITASATSETGDVVPLIYISRTAQNIIIGQQTTLSAALYTIANDFENGLNTIYQKSGTSNYDFTFYNKDVLYTDKLMPTQIQEYTYRDSEFSKLIPDAYFYGDETDVLKRYLSVMARSFDDIKIYIDQFSNLNKISYDKFDRAPDGVFSSLLSQQYGIDLIQTGLNESLYRYFSTVKNKKNSKKVSDELFNRVLNNFILLLKYKGTKEAIESIIRIFGLPTNYLSIKDYKYFQEERVRTKYSYPNTYVLNNTSTAGGVRFVGSASTNWGFFSSTNNFTVEARISLSSNITQTGVSGTILSFGNSANNRGYLLGYKNGQLTFRVNDGIAQTNASNSAQLISALTSGFVNVFGVLSSNSAFIRAYWLSTTSGSGVISSITSGTVSTNSTVSITSNGLTGTIGSTGGDSFLGYIHEVKGYSTVMSELDMAEHARNFESISLLNTNVPLSNLKYHYRLKENYVLTGTNVVIDSSGNGITGAAINTLTANNNYKMIELMPRLTTITTFGNFVEDNTPFTINDNSVKKIRNLTTNVVDISLNPVDAINDDIENVFGSFNVANLISDPRNFTESSTGFKDYLVMSNSAATVFNRYAGNKLNFNAYIKAVNNFAFVLNGIIKLAEQFIPARSRINNSGIVIEQHLLERNKNRVTTVNFVDQIVTGSPISIALTFDTQVQTDEVDIDVVGSTPLSGQVDITEAYKLKNTDAIEDTNEFHPISGDSVILINQNSFKHSKNEVVQLQNSSIFVYPYYQEVADKKDTNIIFTTNKNILETNSSLTSNLNRSAITGNIRLTRTSTGKPIKSQQDTVRIDFPLANSISVISMTADSTVLTGTSANLKINNKNGINFIIKSNINDINRGIQNLRITNILSGKSDDYPIVILSTSADTRTLGGGQTIIKVGSVEI